MGEVTCDTTGEKNFLNLGRVNFLIEYFFMLSKIISLLKYQFSMTSPFNHDIEKIDNKTTSPILKCLSDENSVLKTKSFKRKWERGNRLRKWYMERR